MSALGFVFVMIGALSVTMQLMKIIDWFEPTSPSYSRRHARQARG